MSAPVASAASIPASDESSMSAFLQSGLTLLYKYASKKHEALRQQCVEVLSKIKTEEKIRAEKALKGVVVPADADANKYFLPLKLACDTGQAKLVALALDTMEKLIAYGYLDGNCPVSEDVYPSKKKDVSPSSSTPKPDVATAAAAAKTEESKQNPSTIAQTEANAANGNAVSTTNGVISTTEANKRKLIHVMIETLYDCSMYKDSLVQRQVVKALLTTVSSVSCPVHDHGLLQAVTSCYQIYLQAGDETNRITAKAALTQIFNLVFQRMEHFAAQLKQLEQAAAKQREEDEKTSLQLNEGIPTADEASASPQSASSANSASNNDAGDHLSVSSSVPTLNVDDDSEAQPVEPAINADESDGGEFSASTPINSSVSRPSPTLNSTRPPPGKRGYCVICQKPANHQCLQTRDSVCGMECKLINLNKKDPNRRAALSVKTKIQNKLQILQNDAYYLLRALIKLSHKSFSTMPPEQAAVDSKLLSLTLLHSVMQNAGPTFAANRNFIQLVKVDLVNCLLRNSAASNIDSIFTLSSNIFIALLTHFKPHLYKVIGPMLDSIYIPYIQSPHSSFEHKQTSLNVIKSVCENQQLIVDLFLNYDCSIGSFRTFQKVAEVLEKTTHKRLRGEGDDDDANVTDAEEVKLKTLALEALVGCMNSLAAWSARIVKPNSESMAEAMEHAESTGRTTALAAIGAAAAAAVMNSDADAQAKAARSASVAEPGDSPNPADAPAVSTGVSLASSFSQQFQFLRAQKQKLDSGITKFNQKPKVGIAYLQQHGLLGTDPSDIATFFHSNSGLDKIQLGDYMGEEGDFNKKVLYAYVEQMDFRQLQFDEAIRAFVQGFRLPGEAQKIDRMMEKFAEQYHKNNPGRFHSADTAYVLAYSIILLNTDAHNPGVKRRMTKEDFFKNCRGIDDGKDIDPAFLGEIYDRITTNEIKMKDDPLVNNPDSTKSKPSTATDKKKSFTAFMKESQLMVKRTQELIKTKVVPQPKMGNKLSSTDRKYLDEISKDELDQPENAPTAVNSAILTSGGSSSASTAALTDLSSTDPAGGRGEEAQESKRANVEKVFYEATTADAEAIRPMFEILCFPSLATFSVLLEESDNEQVIRLCLNGYRSSIRIANALEMQTARLAFVSSLQKFTFLGSGKEMKRKNIEAISTLLSLAATAADGNNLHDNWFEILQCISEVERLHLIANNSLRGREMNFTQELVSGSAPVNPAIQNSVLIKGKETETLNSLQVNLIDAQAIDRVFAVSQLLDGEAIIDFVNALRKVSEQELANIHAPRVFSLQKMVEITYFNMGRVRVVWNRIWALLSAFFQKAGCHPHLNVSMYAIDSLRQLSMKFLDIDELSSFQFQRSFLKPFEFIMTHNPNVEIRELVLQCISRMITAKAHNIRSGWKGIFMVLTVAANSTQTITVIKGQPQPSLIQLAFSILSVIMDQYFAVISETGLETMDECVNCCVTFGCNQQYQDIASKSIQFLTNCASSLNKEAENAASIENGTVADETELLDAQHLLRKDSIPSANQTPKHGSTPANASNVSSQVTLKVWFLVLTGLSRMIGDGRSEVRSLALTTLFDILNAHGHVFSAATWRAVFHGCLFPVFDDVRYANEKQPSLSAAEKKNKQFEEEQATLWKESPQEPATAETNEKQSSQTSPSASIDTAPATSGTATQPSSPINRKNTSSTAAPSTVPAALRTNGISIGGTTSTTPAVAAHRPSASAGSAVRRSSLAPAPAHFDNTWLQTTCFTALSSVVELFARFHATVHFLLPEMLALINSCISQEHSEDLAKIGVRCFVVLLQKIGAELTVGDWWHVLDCARDLLEKVVPRVLVSNQLRQALLMPINSQTSSNVYPSLIDVPHVSRNENGNGVAQASATDNGLTTANSTGEGTNPGDAPASTQHARSSSASPLPPPMSLPFQSSSVLTRVKVSVWLVEALFQLVVTFFPSKNQLAVKRIRHDKLQQQLATQTTTNISYDSVQPDANSAATAASSSVTLPLAPAAASSATPQLFAFRDPRILGAFTPIQTVYAVDLLGDSINFTHQFNSDITLRRKLHAAGFHIPAPNISSAATAGQHTTAANASLHPSPSPTTVPSASPSPSPAPITATAAVAANSTKPARLPQLFYQEAHFLRLAMDLLFKLLIESQQPVDASATWTQELNITDVSFGSAGVSSSEVVTAPLLLVERRVMSLCQSSIDEYVTKTQAGQLVSLEYHDEVLIGWIQNFAALPGPLFARYLPHFYLGLTQLIEFAQVSGIRHAIRNLFANNIANLLQEKGVQVKAAENSKATPAV